MKTKDKIEEILEHCISYRNEERYEDYVDEDKLILEIQALLEKEREEAFNDGREFQTLTDLINEKKTGTDKSEDILREKRKVLKRKYLNDESN